MKTFIYEIGVFDRDGRKHPVKFKEGLNVVTGKSSTGKSALIEIFDYCFGSGENTIPKGVITNHASLYYVALAINEQDILIARNPNQNTRAFLRLLDSFDSESIRLDFFNQKYFLSLEKFKKDFRAFFLDIDDVDESLIVRNYRHNKAKAPTPSIRSFASFMLQHQNLIANKHALFYRFDEKAKRDQVLEHIKIFLGLVDQDFFHLSQEKEKLNIKIKGLKRQKIINKQTAEKYEYEVESVLKQLYVLMGFDSEPLNFKEVLNNPEGAKKRLNELIVFEKINYQSSKSVEHYNYLKQQRNEKTYELRKLQNRAASINKHISQEENLVNRIKKYDAPRPAQISTSVCPFCHSEKNSLRASAENLKKAIEKVSDNLAQMPSMKAIFKSSLNDVKDQIDKTVSEISSLSQQITSIENVENELSNYKDLYESIVMCKAKLYIMFDTLEMSKDFELNEQIMELSQEVELIDKKIKKYDVERKLAKASATINQYMAEIGKEFPFEESYHPINLQFSFETFDLYHLTPEKDRLYLRTMGSGANWLYSHLTLFLSLHEYFVELGNDCSIPSVLFLDQPTQVYFPNFKRDNSESFEEQKDKEMNQRISGERTVDEDIRAVENLFSQLSIYCNRLKEKYGFSPQIIVSDHADDLILSNGVLFDSLVNGNRWRTRGLIEPVSDLNS